MKLFSKIGLWIVMLRNLSFRLLSFVNRNKMSVEFYMTFAAVHKRSKEFFVDIVLQPFLCGQKFLSKFCTSSKCAGIFHRHFASLSKMSLEFSVHILLLPFSCRQKFLSTSYWHGKMSAENSIDMLWTEAKCGWKRYVGTTEVISIKINTSKAFTTVL